MESVRVNTLAKAKAICKARKGSFYKAFWRDDIKSDDIREELTTPLDKEY